MDVTLDNNIVAFLTGKWIQPPGLVGCNFNELMEFQPSNPSCLHRARSSSNIAPNRSESTNVNSNIFRDCTNDNCVPLKNCSKNSKHALLATGLKKISGREKDLCTGEINTNSKCEYLVEAPVKKVSSVCDKRKVNYQLKTSFIVLTELSKNRFYSSNDLLSKEVMNKVIPHNICNPSKSVKKNKRSIVSLHKNLQVTRCNTKNKNENIQSPLTEASHVGKIQSKCRTNSEFLTSQPECSRLLRSSSRDRNTVTGVSETNVPEKNIKYTIEDHKRDNNENSKHTSRFGRAIKKVRRGSDNITPDFVKSIQHTKPAMPKKAAASKSLKETNTNGAIVCDNSNGNDSTSVPVMVLATENATDNMKATTASDSDVSRVVKNSTVKCQTVKIKEKDTGESKKNREVSIKSRKDKENAKQNFNAKQRNTEKNLKKDAPQIVPDKVTAKPGTLTYLKQRQKRQEYVLEQRQLDDGDFFTDNDNAQFGAAKYKINKQFLNSPLPNLSSSNLSSFLNTPSSSLCMSSPLTPTAASPEGGALFTPRTALMARFSGGEDGRVDCSALTTHGGAGANVGVAVTPGNTLDQSVAHRIIYNNKRNRPCKRELAAESNQILAASRSLNCSLGQSPDTNADKRSSGKMAMQAEYSHTTSARGKKYKMLKLPGSLEEDGDNFRDDSDEEDAYFTELDN